MSDRIVHSFYDGKYTVIYEAGKLRAERHGEPWRDLVGDGMVLAMLQGYDDLWRKANKMECLLHRLQEPRYGLMPDVVTTIRSLVGEEEMPEAEAKALTAARLKFRDDLYDGKLAPSDILLLWEKANCP